MFSSGTKYLEASSRRLSPSKSNSSSFSSPALVTLTVFLDFDVLEIGFPSGPSSFSRTSRGSVATEVVNDCLRPDPFGLREEDNKDVEESLEWIDREDDRGLKPGLCAAEAGPKWLGLRGLGL